MLLHHFDALPSANGGSKKSNLLEAEVSQNLGKARGFTYGIDPYVIFETIRMLRSAPFVFPESTISYGFSLKNHES